MTETEIYEFARTYNRRRAKRGMATKKSEMQRELRYKVGEVNHWTIMCRGCRGISKNEPELQKARKELAEMVELAKEYV